MDHTASLATSPSTTIRPSDLLALREEPVEIGVLAEQATRKCHGDTVLVCARPAVPGVGNFVWRRGEWIAVDGWPAASMLKPGDEIVCTVNPEQATSWLEYLEVLRIDGPPALALAPVCPRDGATFKLWLMATARLVAGTVAEHKIHVQARHDILGLRLAQITLGFGANVLAGPVADDRHLPLAGVTRPTENSRTGLSSLVEQAARRPVITDNLFSGERT